MEKPDCRRVPFQCNRDVRANVAADLLVSLRGYIETPQWEAEYGHGVLLMKLQIVDGEIEHGQHVYDRKMDRGETACNEHSTIRECAHSAPAAARSASAICNRKYQAGALRHGQSTLSRNKRPRSIHSTREANHDT